MAKTHAPINTPTMATLNISASSLVSPKAREKAPTKRSIMLPGPGKGVSFFYIIVNIPTRVPTIIIAW